MYGIPTQARNLTSQYLRQKHKQTLSLHSKKMVVTSTKGHQLEQPIERLQDEDYDRFTNTKAKCLESSLIRKLCALKDTSPAGTHFMACGLPNIDCFPFKEAAFTLKSGETITLKGKNMEDAQQYTSTSGYPPLLEQVKELVVRYHNPPNFHNSDVLITIGAQDGFTRTMSLLLSPGDYVITEDPTFTGMLSDIKQYNVNTLGVQSDAFGMVPESLEEILSSRWDPQKIRKAQSGIPKVLYINPTASNPSGVTTTKERKKEIYELARLYNMLIIEDDPYYFIEFREPGSYEESFLSMDTDGRVMRFDSFSKLLGGGFRIGFLTGPKELVSKYMEHMEATTLQASTLSQVVANELLKKWSREGLETHIENIRQFYKKQRDALNAAAEKHLKGLCEWNIPTGGMFLWIKVCVLEDVQEMVLKRGPNKRLILMPGNPFMVDDKKPCQYIRLSYSFTSAAEMDEASISNKSSEIKTHERLYTNNTKSFLQKTLKNKKRIRTPSEQDYLDFILKSVYNHSSCSFASKEDVVRLRDAGSPSQKREFSLKKNNPNRERPKTAHVLFSDNSKNSPKIPLTVEAPEPLSRCSRIARNGYARNPFGNFYID